VTKNNHSEEIICRKILKSPQGLNPATHLHEYRATDLAFIFKLVLKANEEQVLAVDRRASTAGHPARWPCSRDRQGGRGGGGDADPVAVIKGQFLAEA
jgi:hypothetical protein